MTTEHTWTFLSNHAHVLICLYRDGSLRIRDVALMVGITERAVQRIISELVESGYMEVLKDGRRNQYHICAERHLRHPVEAHRQVADLMALVASAAPPLPVTNARPEERS